MFGRRARRKSQQKGRRQHRLRGGSLFHSLPLAMEPLEPRELLVGNFQILPVAVGGGRCRRGAGGGVGVRGWPQPGARSELASGGPA